MHTHHHTFIQTRDDVCGNNLNLQPSIDNQSLYLKASFYNLSCFPSFLHHIQFFLFFIVSLMILDPIFALKSN